MVHLWLQYRSNGMPWSMASDSTCTWTWTVVFRCQSSKQNFVLLYLAIVSIFIISITTLSFVNCAEISFTIFIVRQLRMETFLNWCPLLPKCLIKDEFICGSWSPFPQFELKPGSLRTCLFTIPMPLTNFSGVLFPLALMGEKCVIFRSRYFSTQIVYSKFYRVTGHLIDGVDNEWLVRKVSFHLFSLFLIWGVEPFWN